MSLDLATGPAHAAAQRSVAVRAPGRLHLGFLDPSATLGRRFGSVGLVVEGVDTVLELGRADGPAIEVQADDPLAAQQVERVHAALHALQRETGLVAPLRVSLLRVPPPHAGFGSGTQLALAVGQAFAQWHGLALRPAALAGWLGRGLRSGVGIAGFEHGGLLVDGGPSPDGRPAPLLSRVGLPAMWRVLLVIDPRGSGLAGRAEREAIAGLPPLPRADAADLCHQVLMRVLPGAASGDFAAFAEGVTHLQRRLGAHFAPAQQGSAYTSAAVGRAVEAIGVAAGGPAGAAIGQSSWGPTGFAVLPSQERAEALVAHARAAGEVDPALELRIVRVRDHGAEVELRMPSRPPDALR